MCPVSPRRSRERLTAAGKPLLVSTEQRLRQRAGKLVLPTAASEAAPRPLVRRLLLPRLCLVCAERAGGQKNGQGLGASEGAHKGLTTTTDATTTPSHALRRPQLSLGVAAALPDQEALITDRLCCNSWGPAPRGKRRNPLVLAPTATPSPGHTHILGPLGPGGWPYQAWLSCLHPLGVWVRGGSVHPASPTAMRSPRLCGRPLASGGEAASEARGSLWGPAAAEAGLGLGGLLYAGSEVFSHPWRGPGEARPRPPSA